MVISDSLRMLFVHVQKTGGSTTDRWLTDTVPDVRRIGSLDRHAPLRQILAAEPELADYWIFGAVRNPWERLLSWHRMVLRWLENVPDGVRVEDHPRFARNGFLLTVATEMVDFEHFVMDGPERFGRLRRPQVAYLGDQGRTVDFTARQERLDDDLAAVAERFGLTPPDGRPRNVDRERPDYRDHYTPAMRDRVAELYAADLKAFGYTF
ncbi:MAG: hypothetical protein CMH83_13190 [Nocardioides sp.]|nr:hypothetical protein [Nocardioides sp.]